MLFKYSTLSVSTIAQVIADIAALCTGGSIDALSASCDKVNSAILANTEASGWSLIDAAGPNLGKVLTAKDAYGNDKIVSINAYNATTLGMVGYETYNPITHTGTAATTPTSFMPSHTANAPQTFYVYATARSLFIFSSNGTTAVGSLEFTREAPALSANYYQSYGLFSNITAINSSVCFIRTKNNNNTGDYTARINTGSIIGLTGCFGAVNTYRDSTDAVIYPSTDLYIQDGVLLGKMIDIIGTLNIVGTFMDTVVFDDVTYFVVPCHTGHSYRMLFKFG